MIKSITISHIRLATVGLFAILGLFSALVPQLAHAQDAAQPTAAPQTTQAAGTPTPSVSSYQINPGDQLEIYVWGEERLQRQLNVLPDGTIAFPLVGQMRVAGLRPQEVEQMVSDRLRSQYRGEVPFVTVSVRAPTGMQFSIMGKVNAPGSFNAGRYLNVLEALSMAGGPAEFANLDSVLLVRGNGDQAKTFRLRLADLFKAGASTSDVERAGIVRVMPGDVIIVP